MNIIKIPGDSVKNPKQRIFPHHSFFSPSVPLKQPCAVERCQRQTRSCPTPLSSAVYSQRNPQQQSAP